MKTLNEKYHELKGRLSFSGEAEAEARRILSFTQCCSLSELPLRLAEPCLHEEDIEDIIEKRLSGMPLAYALQSKPFYGREHYVDENVLIPRYDSECVAERAIALSKECGYQTALDLCCGSGCLGIALLLEGSLPRVDFADISGEALYIASQNLRRLAPEKEECCAFYEGDLFTPVKYAYDLLICNPPYISHEEYAGLDKQVKEFEPAHALLAEKGGYEFYERLAKESALYVNPGGALVVEIGSTQKDGVTDLLAAAGFTNIQCGEDLAGKPRVISAEAISS